MQEPWALFPEQEQLKCPRCDSSNTKFCYYNNYNLSQPRHFCKSCRRYWTKGGALRNIPVGGATRKNTNKRNPKTHLPPTEPPSSAEMFRDWLSSDRASGSGSGSGLGGSGESNLDPDSARMKDPDLKNEGFLGFQMGAGGEGGSGWPDLVIYTPGSSSMNR